jgi:hypothetical protein
MANTFVKIAAVTVGSGGASSIDFTSIPSTYTDLCVLVSARGTRADAIDALAITFNSTTSGESSRELFGTGSAVGSGSDPSGMYLGYIPGDTATASTFGNSMLYIPNYAGSNSKSSSADSVSENNATRAGASLEANLWANSAAITSIKLENFLGDTLMQYSTATLYGIKNS